MAFVLTADSRSPELLEVQEGNSWAVISSIGYDDEEPFSYSLVVGFEPSGGGVIEFYFHVIRADLENDSEYIYWSGKDVSQFISSEYREIIRKILQKAVLELLMKTNPPYVFMVTRDENPPEKALLKYDFISRLFESFGYAVECGEDYHGKRTWTMERPS